VKNRKSYNIKKLSLLGIFFFFTNFLSINLLKKVNLNNVYINGAEFISINDITKNSSLQLPSRLIFIKTELIEKELMQNMYLRKISINRQIFPFGLSIYIQTRKPIAFADKQENGIKVEGFVDEGGTFIDKKFLPRGEKLIFPIRVTGWKKEHKELISLITKRYKDNDDLKVIKISSEGFITLEEKFLQKIYLGSQNYNLEEKLNLIFDIKEEFKNQQTSKKIKSLDLTDLTNPKIKVFIP
tara:strand:+ start:204 stop:926 length:723 start_codon:yes stop_codon:yes gene_type:complete